MSTKRITLLDTEHIRIVKKKGGRDGLNYQLINKRTGFYTSWNEDELFDLAEALDDICDGIEDRLNGG